MYNRFMRAFARLHGYRVTRRRLRNLRAGAATRGPHAHSIGRPPAPALAWLLFAVTGGALIAAHATHLAASAGAPPGSPLGEGARYQAAMFQQLLPGLEFEIDAAPGVALHQHAGGTLLVASNMEGAPAQRMNLCAYLAGSRVTPVKIGYRFAQVRAPARDTQARAVALAAATSADVPPVRVSGMASSDFSRPLQVQWDGTARWIGDASAGRPLAAGPGALGREGWLVWDGGALRISRRESARCPAAGELVIQLLRPAHGAHRAHATAFARGLSASAWLAPGRYAVPIEPLPGLEDEALFHQLQDKGLVRLGRDGLAELVPRDLAAWRAADAGLRSSDLAAWRGVALDDITERLIARLYRMADGEFVRRQVMVFNDERRLLAWRVRPSSMHGDWQASVGGMAASTSAAMPAAASALFAELPQGWSPWTRVAAWPQAGTERQARLELRLPRPARAGETLQLMLVGRVLHVEGATMGPPAPACTGRACPSPAAVQAAVLELEAGARAVTVLAEPLALATLADAANAAYRHLAVEGGQLAWRRIAQPLPGASGRAASDAAIVDRNGTLLWNGGRPTPAASRAGLDALLGYRAGQSGSVAGMLARIGAGGRHSARLSIDLPLQTVAQSALECIGLRGGQWLGGACTGAQPVPAGRRAGLVLIDTETGDILAAAGAGNQTVTDSNWAEARDFDRSNPARSPFRLPALQHDGGVHQSPGSTFKVISALGLELAARGDAQIDALLAGMPLAEIDRVARRRGFAFQSEKASYPYDSARAHITNYREDRLGRRADQGRFGLAQALTYSVNTWFAWAGELSDRSLYGRAEGGAPALQPLEAAALDDVRPVVAMARRVGFGQPLRLDGGLLPPDFAWDTWDVLQPSPGRIDPVSTRHELRQMTIGLRMQATPLQMALAAAAVGQGRFISPRLLLALDGEQAQGRDGEPVPVRLDRIRAGMKGVVDEGTAAGAFRGAALDSIRRGLYGKTGTAPTVAVGPGGARTDVSTVWFTGYLEPGSLPGQQRRLAFAAFVSHSGATGGAHAAPVIAALLRAWPQNVDANAK